MVIKLSELDVGESATVTKVTADENMHRRLLDIGLVDKTRVKCVLKAPSGDPLAFLIRGAVIAIRKKDCNGIEVRVSEG